MKNLPIFDSKYKTSNLYSQPEAYAFDSHYITPPKIPQSNPFHFSNTNKPPLNTKFVPLETVSKQNYKPTQPWDSDKISSFHDRNQEKSNNSFERKPIFDQTKSHVTFVNQLNTPSQITTASYGRKMSAGVGGSNCKAESLFITNCPDCHRFINLLDYKSSKNQALEEYLKELLNLIPGKKESSESFVSNNGLFEGKDAHIEQKYGKYLKNSLSKNSILESPIASRNILFSNHKKMSTTMNSFDYYNGKSKPDDSFLSVDRKKEDKIRDLEQEIRDERREKMEDVEILNDKVVVLKEEIRTKDAEIRRLSEMNRKLMEDMNSLMKIRLL